ncbi:MAG: hypothetical protein V3U19_10595 [Thermodesulfobacteriota bacterium]
MESDHPVGPTEIGKEVGLKRQSVQYYLTSWEKEGKVESNDGGYWIKGKDEFKVINKDLLALLNEKGKLEEKEIIRVLESEYDAEKIKDSLNYSLISNGYIKTFIGSEKKLGIFHEITPLGHSRLGICPICREELLQEDTVLIGFKTEKKWKPNPRNTRHYLAHLHCHKKIKSGFHSKGCCDYCSLPLSPKLIPKHAIKYNSIQDCFYETEIATIRILESICQGLRKRIRDFEERKEVGNLASSLGNSELLAVYDRMKHETGSKVPEWIEKSIKGYEGGVKMIKGGALQIIVEPPFAKVFREISKILFLDLSDLSGSEHFMKVLLKYHSEFPDEYDIDRRIDEIWGQAKKLREKNERHLESLYRELLAPVGSVYNTLSPLQHVGPNPESMFDLIKTFDGLHGYPELEDDSVVFSHSVGYRDGNKVYHPYCAEKLGLTNQSHGHDKTERR